MVFSADCGILLLHDPVSRCIGAVHAGWRGTALGLPAKTVREMERLYGAEAENIRGAVGAGIGPCCFETDGDVPEAMRGAFGAEAEPFIRSAGNKYYVNLKEINALVLRQAGVRQIAISRECTACDNRRFWSHRITQGLRGSQGAVIVCKEGRK